MHVHGVDFSGSAEPGEDIWLVSGRCPAEGTTDDDLELRVTAARPASEAFGATARGPVLDGLRRFLRGEHDAATAEQVTGLDCSFGLPATVIPDAVAATGDWAATLAWVREAFADVDGRSFRTALKERARASDADGVELKRATDGPTGASSPYSFITRYQTLHGLRELLGPLVEREAVAVPPMVPPGSVDRPALVEVYPAATLRHLGLPDRKYKGDQYPEARDRRERILDGLLGHGVTLDGVSRERLLADTGGDALDALVGAVAVARNLPDLAVDRTRYDPIEGYIYV